MGVKVVATNRKARFEYFLLEQYEAGISLFGSEIKSVRAGQISLAEAFVQTDGVEAWLMNAHIAPYVQANRYNHDPKRPRRLLLHKREISEITATTMTQSGRAACCCTNAKLVKSGMRCGKKV